MRWPFAVCLLAFCAIPRAGSSYSPAGGAAAGYLHGNGSRLQNHDTRTQAAVSLIIPVEEPTLVHVDSKLSPCFGLIVSDTQQIFYVFKQVAGTVGGLFSYHDAHALRNFTEVGSWRQSHCSQCSAPKAVLPGGTTAEQGDIRNLRRLHRKLRSDPNVKTICCRSPGTLIEQQGAGIHRRIVDHDDLLDIDWTNMDLVVSAMLERSTWTPEKSKAATEYYSDWYTGVIPEDKLSPPLQLQAWDGLADRDGVLKDLDATDTAVVQWSPGLSSIMSSQDLFTMLRMVFQQRTTNGVAFYESLGVDYVSTHTLGFSTKRGSWITKRWANSQMRAFVDYTKAAMDEAQRMAGYLRGLPEEVTLYSLFAEVDYFWIPANSGAIRNPDYRGIHIDPGMMQFATADQPGLVVRYDTDKLSRVPIAPNTFSLMKCTLWDPVSWLRGKIELTWHTVFGPDIVQNGRVSMIITIRGKPQYDFLNYPAPAPDSSS